MEKVYKWLKSPSLLTEDLGSIFRKELMHIRDVDVDVIKHYPTLWQYIHPQYVVKHARSFKDMPCEIAYQLWKYYKEDTKLLRQTLRLSVHNHSLHFIIKFHRQLGNNLTNDLWKISLENAAPSIHGVLLYLYWDALILHGVFHKNEEEKKAYMSYWDNLKLPHWKLLCSSIQHAYSFDQALKVLTPMNKNHTFYHNINRKMSASPSLLSVPWLSSTLHGEPVLEIPECEIVL